MSVPSKTGRLKREAKKGFWLGLLLLLSPSFVIAASPAPAFAITDFVTCQYANTSAPFDWHGPQAVFQTDTDKFFAWVEVTQVSGKHHAKMELYRPDGTYYGEESGAINETNGVKRWWRMSSWWSIKGEPLAQTPGLWKLDLVIDGTLQRSITLNISSGNPVLTAKGQPGLATLAAKTQTNSMSDNNGPGAVSISKSAKGLLPAKPNILFGLKNLGGGAVRILGFGDNNQTYTVQYTTSLQPPVIWTILGSATANSAGSWYYDDSTGSATRFYRSYLEASP